MILDEKVVPLKGTEHQYQPLSFRRTVERDPYFSGA